MAWCKSGTRTTGLGTWGTGTRDPPQSLKVGLQDPPTEFKSGTFIIIFLHCLTYFVLDMSDLVCLTWWQMERSMQLVWRPNLPDNS